MRGDSSVAVHLKGSHRCVSYFPLAREHLVPESTAVFQQLVHEFLTSPSFNDVIFFFSPATSLCAVLKKVMVLARIVATKQNVLSRTGK